jgi:thiopurine S-methyltransferase
MDKDFWLARWQAQEIGFHQDEINAHLQQYWPELKARPGATVFVPLCGKSRDMLWLAAQGFKVIGIEVSDIAVQTFFTENDLQPILTPQDHFKEYSCGEITILHGDFFDLSKKDLAAVSAVFDRASLIALPENMRQAYAQHLSSILPRTIKSLLITLDYPQEQMDGPPFAVSQREVEALFAPEFDVQSLQCLAILDEEPRFRKRGLSRLDERVFLLSRP